MKPRKHASLAAAAPVLHTHRQQASLYAASDSPILIDETAGVLRNVAVMTEGEALGWGFKIDKKTLTQTLACLNDKPGGVRVRFRHPETDGNGNPRDGTGTMVGVVRNCRIVGRQIRGDVELDDYAAAVPGHGDVRTYLIGLAKRRPELIGLSCVIDYETEEGSREDVPPARVFAVDAVDFAEQPAANPRGLLAAVPQPQSQNSPGALPGGVAPFPKGGSAMDPVSVLQSLGFDPTGQTPEAIDAFVLALPPEQQQQLAAAGWVQGWSPAAVPAAPAVAPMGEGEESEEETEEAPLCEGDEEEPPAQTSRGKLAARNGQRASLSVAALEQRRVASLRKLGQAYGCDAEFVSRHIGANTSEKGFIVAARAHLSKKFAATGTGEVRVGEDRNIASLGAGIGDALRIRAGAKVAQPHERHREFSGLTLPETARAYLGAIGVNTAGMSRHDICRLVFNRGRLASMSKAQLAHSTGDFSNIMRDAINKTIRDNYAETPITWTEWCRRATTNDFKTIYRTQLSNAPRPRRLKAGQEYPDKSLSDGQETYVINKYGEIITLTWESLVNDDMNALSRVPQVMGAAMKRLEDDVAYYVLLANAAMADTGDLFNTTAVTTAGGHANQSASAAAPSITTLGAARLSMRKKTGLKGELLNLVPEFLIVPAAYETASDQVLNSQFDMAQSNSITKNPFTSGGRTPMKLIVEPRLDTGVSIETETGTLDTKSGSATNWYVAANSNQIDTVEVCFLESEPEPVTEEEDAFRTDGRSYKIRHCVGAKAIDYRGLYRNA